MPIAEQWAALTAKLRGHFAYHGIAGNIASLGRFRYQARRVSCTSSAMPPLGGQGTHPLGAFRRAWSGGSRCPRPG